MTNDSGTVWSSVVVLKDGSSPDRLESRYDQMLQHFCQVPVSSSVSTDVVEGSPVVPTDTASYHYRPIFIGSPLLNGNVCQPLSTPPPDTIFSGSCFPWAAGALSLLHTSGFLVALPQSHDDGVRGLQSASHFTPRKTILQPRNCSSPVKVIQHSSRGHVEMVLPPNASAAYKD